MSSALSVDYVTTLVLAILLTVKYVLFDHDEDDAMATVATVTESTISEAANSRAVKSCFGDGQTEPAELQAPTNKPTKFYVGDSSSDDNDSDIESATTSTIQTQTEEVENQPTTERPRPPRPLNECVAILNAVV